mgnify:CR=1 FL=1
MDRNINPDQLDERYMRLALALAAEAAAEGEVPVGAVIVRDGAVVGTGRNRRETARSALAHAEIEAIADACRRLGGWRLFGSTLYVTLEPCPMCAGAIINARIDRVVYGARDSKAGSCGSVTDLFVLPYNHKPAAEGGLLEGECGAMLSDFFRGLRENRQRVPASDPAVDINQASLLERDGLHG